MYIVLASPECAPVAKAGGLGDFVQGLARELAIRGNHVEIVLPKYDSLRFDRVWGMHKVYTDLLGALLRHQHPLRRRVRRGGRAQVLLHRRALRSTASSTAARSTATPTTRTASRSSRGR
jgi:glycogen synthase